ncbi:hypothetical protein H6F85_19065 [Microcoleus sp. FACHB-45]|nr:hypothetical protein [Microcoleus sp. FACHB-45]
MSFTNFTVYSHTFLLFVVTGFKRIHGQNLRVRSPFVTAKTPDRAIVE